MKGVVNGLVRKVIAAAIGMLPRNGHAEQSRADDLKPGDHEEDADQQADGDPARHRAAGEAPEFAVQDALAERLHPAAPGQLLAARHVAFAAQRPRRPAWSLSHAARIRRPCSRFQSFSF